jgi:hypothetical protein
MRRILLVALLGTIVVAVPTSTAAAKPKPPSFKVGAYKSKAEGLPFAITLKHAKCGGKLQFCVSLPVSPTGTCNGPVVVSLPVGNFTAPVALPSSGKVTQHAPITGSPIVPGETVVPTGQSTFSVTFTKKGTATGYLEESLNLSLQGRPIPCTGKVSFTAKLG